MSSSLDTVSASDAERRTKRPRLRGRRRILAVASIALALLGGTVAESGAAFAQSPPGACTQWCNNPPAGVNQQDWNEAVMAADFWANHYIDWNSRVNYGWGQYRILQPWNGHGWPGRGDGQRWYAYRDGRGYGYVYYGGEYEDRNGFLTQFDIGAHGGNSSTSYQHGPNGPSSYIEYDINGHNAPNDPRDAWRIVRNVNNGNTYATFDHYNSWNYLGRY
ncbi:hypothetical protein ACFY1U_16290 [Streptomyces sp. NPDC001351]|uniref:hypothetical protein n=1 Tax=Streptomyces sp. NPDC001351 TaxID=3364564 RepID=UPI003692FF30